MQPESSYSSYRDIEPLESGGEVNRNGLEFQDHVAAGYCIDMLESKELIEVWCESLDDITLVWNKEGDEEFEFIQAKSTNFGQFWSVAKLCERDKKHKTPVIGTSILEKSLAYERGKESCRFRLITSVAVGEELQVLTLPLDSPSRVSPCPNLDKLKLEIEKRLDGCLSPKGSDAASWLSRTVWEVRYSDKAVENENLLRLMASGRKLAIFLAEDQWREIYSKILRKVQEAGKAKWAINPRAKRIKRDDFLEWLKNAAMQALHPGSGTKGEKLNEKMQDARIPSDTIETAQEQRRAYRTRILDPAYMDLSKRQDLEMETQARLNHLRAQLYAGCLTDTGIEFHNRCLNLLSEISSSHPDNVSQSFLQGYMYHLTDRCLHRFTRVAA